jgi:hypothetical protein
MARLGSRFIGPPTLRKGRGPRQGPPGSQMGPRWVPSSKHDGQMGAERGVQNYAKALSQRGLVAMGASYL